ncbi:SPX domain-containing protein [Choanephora cucurbitarum]|nr:SPX domain-containing protein [Choanephora cucurbitarum]
MKFGKQLETEAEDIPSEWRPYLIQYKALKKIITRVAEEIESRGLSASLLHECLEDSGNEESLAIHDNEQDHDNDNIPKIKYYFIGEVPNVKPCIEFSYDPSEPKVQQMLSKLLISSETPNQDADRPKLEYKRSHNNKDIFSLSSSVSSGEENVLHSPAFTRQRRDSTVQLVKELVKLTLAERDRIKDSHEHEDMTERAELMERGQLKTLVIELEQDDEFFKLLLAELDQAAKLQNVTSQRFEEDINSLESCMTKAAAPTQKSEMYHWRKIFSVYMDAQIFQGNAEADRTFRSVERAKRQMTWFVEQLNRQDLLKKFKTKESKSAFEQFIALNTELITMKHYQVLNQTAMRKILKKHDKRSGLTASQSFPELVSTEQLFSPKLAGMLYATITSKLTSIIPQPDDYACPVCMNVAWRPIRLRCDHVFCVRCLVKAQKKKMDGCPLCRHPTAVRDATALNLDEGLQNFLKLYFPQEIKEKKRDNEREQAIEDIQAMTGKKYSEEQLMRMSQQSHNKCLIM